MQCKYRVVKNSEWCSCSFLDCEPTGEMSFTVSSTRGQRSSQICGLQSQSSIAVTNGLLIQFNQLINVFLSALSECLRKVHGESDIIKVA